MVTNIYSILRRKFPESEYALLEEVSDKAGFGRSRSADFILMNLWPSRGLSLHGIELKSFRSDWLREIKKPQKAENIFQYCDYFWLLTADESVAKMEEIPETWGWMTIKGGKIFVKKEAPRLSPIEMSRSFLACMLKRACSKSGYVRRDEIEQQLTEARGAGERKVERELDQLHKKFTDLDFAVKEYKKVTGIDLANRGWNTSATDIGKLVNFLQNGGTDQIKKQLLAMEPTIKALHEKINFHLESLQKAEHEPETSNLKPETLTK